MIKKKEIRVDGKPVFIFEHDGLYWPAQVSGSLIKRLVIRGNVTSFTDAALKRWSKSYKTVEEAEANAWKILPN